MLGQASRPRISLLICPEFLGVTMKLGFAEEDCREVETCWEDYIKDVPRRCPPLQFIELFSADAPNKQLSFGLSDL